MLISWDVVRLGNRFQPRLHADGRTFRFLALPSYGEARNAAKHYARTTRDCMEGTA
jgi:hypothetical protein